MNIKPHYSLRDWHQIGSRRGSLERSMAFPTSASDAMVNRLRLARQGKRFYTDKERTYAVHHNVPEQS